jgi:hypothetical protein
MNNKTATNILTTIISAVFLALTTFSSNAQITYHLSISSTSPWTDTGISVYAGALLSIQATGTVSYFGDNTQAVTGPGGTNYDGTQFFPESVYPNTTVVSLIGKIGGTTTIGTGTALPGGLPGNGVGYVGSSYSEVVPTTGELFLGFNDQVGSFGDNSGSFQVSVTVAPVPEPSTFGLAGLAGLCLVAFRRLAKA